MKAANPVVRSEPLYGIVGHHYERNRKVTKAAKSLLEIFNHPKKATYIYLRGSLKDNISLEKCNETYVTPEYILRNCGALIRNIVHCLVACEIYLRSYTGFSVFD